MVSTVSNKFFEVKQVLLDEFTTLQKESELVKGYMPDELEIKFSKLLKQLKEIKSEKK